MVQTLTRPSGFGVSTIGAPRTTGMSAAPDALSNALAFVLAGGEGRRLRPLTRDRSKPFIRFGGQHRLVDFALSNLLNAGFRRIVVLSRNSQDPLHDHISGCWPDPFTGGETPLNIRARPGPFGGSAGALRQCLDLIGNGRLRHIVVLAADHVCRIDPGGMLRRHLDAGAGLTIAAIAVPITEAPRFGIIEVDGDAPIGGFEEKPRDPVPLPTDPSRALASMGTYVFDSAILTEALTGADRPTAEFDIGRHVVPLMVSAGRAFTYDFDTDLADGGSGYWRDVGTIDAYYRASMDLVAGCLDLDRGHWPIRTAHSAVSPSRMVAGEGGAPAVVTDSLVAGDTVIEGAIISGSVLAPGVAVGSGAWVEDSVLLDGAIVGPEAVVRRAVVGERTEVPACATVDLTVAGRRRWTVSAGGVVVVTRGDRIGVRKGAEHRSRADRNRPQAPVPLQLVANLDP